MDDIVGILVFRDERNHLRLREDGAGGGNGDILAVLEAVAAHFIEAHFHGSCHHLQKTPGARRALVVHHEAGDPSVPIQYDDLGILPADIDHTAHGGIEIVCSLRVAGDFRDALIRILNCRSAVARGYDPADVLPPQICLAESLLQRPVRADPGTGAGGNHRPADYPSGPVQNHDVRRGGSGINAGKIGGLSPGLISGAGR